MVYTLKSLTTLFLRFNRIRIVGEEIRNLRVSAKNEGSVHTKRQRQRCDNCGMTLAMLLSLKTMELLQIGIAAHFQATGLFSMRTVLPASLQSYCSVDAEARYK